MSQTGRETTHIQLRCAKMALLWARRLGCALCLLWLSPAVLAQTLSQTEIQKLLASDAASRDLHGDAVALTDDRALVGSPGADDSSGSTYVYERDETGLWVEVATLTASDAAMDDRFGCSVALSGDRALVGAFRDDHTRIDAGSAYVYERDETGQWVEVAKLTAADAGRNDNFGFSVALSDDRVLVGSYQDDDADNASGSAYLYARDEETGRWQEVAKLTASDAAEDDGFGSDVALFGDQALVAASTNDDAGTNSGSAYVYERAATGLWVEAAKLTASDGASRDLGFWRATSR